MLRTKAIDRIVCVLIALMLATAVCLWGMVKAVQGDTKGHTIGYEDLLFDKSRVHTIDITMDGWDGFIANATAEEYTQCDITVDGEKYKDVAIRAKGNTSLSSVATLGSSRYSFKVEFNHYVKGRTYHGLDKLSLNNLIQDSTMMKDYLAYTLMERMGVPASQCSYVQISVNGEPWGLYLAVEGVEDSFMDRNGMTKGELYKPDSMSFGGGRGNGRDFDIEQFRVEEDEDSTEETGAESTAETTGTAQPAATEDGASFGGSSGMPAGDGTQQAPQGDFAASGGDNAQGDGFAASGGDSAQMPDMQNMPEMPAADGDNAPDQGFPGMPGGGGGFGGFNFGMGSEDVKLVYSDDDPDSYSNIFNNAKTSIKTKDKTRLIETLKKLNEKEDLDNVVDKEEVTTYLAVHNFLCNDDSYTGMMVHNYYLYEEKGKLSIIPWDYNLGFGGFSAGTDATSTVNSPIDSPVSSGTTDSRPLIAWIFSDEEALANYHVIYSRFLEENIENGWLEAEIDRVQEMISSYVAEDPSAFYTAEEFEKGVETLKTFCRKRGESVRGQLDGTIPSTSNGQRSSSALIDASEISTADMGTMNSDKGGGFTGGGMPGGGMPDISGSGFTPPTGFTGETDQQGDGGSFGGRTETDTNNDTQPAESAEPEASTQPEESAQPENSKQPDGMGPSNGGQTQPDGTGASNGGQAQPDGTGASNGGQAQPEDSTQPDGMGVSNGGQAQPEGMTASNGGQAQPAGSEQPDGIPIPGGEQAQPEETAETAQPEENTQQPENTEPAESTKPETGAQPAESTQSGNAENRQDRPEGGFPGGGNFPGGGDFPGGNFPGGAQADQTTEWIWVAACALLLLAMILIIRRAGNHNR